MKKIILTILSISMLTPWSKADEGMWLLPLIKKYNSEQLQSAGFRLSPEDIYSINQNSLKDAIVIFGGGCTGEIVSPEGLLFTNHHCGYGSIQALSSIEQNYLMNGFWAKNKKQELSAKGLKVQFVRNISDVTAQVLKGTTVNMNEKKRAKTITKNIKALTKTADKEYKSKNENLAVRITPIFGGNQYLQFIYETFGDVRLVGAPPQNLGKYGGNTDNWMWPRHTGDFSIFRVYASADNKSTKEYSADNVPYKAPTHLPISTKGVKEGDFAMVLGFPGSTKRYMTTWEIDQTLNVTNPIRIFIRGEKQKIWWEDMMADPKVRLQYSSKFAGSSNYWKNAIGMSRGLKRLNIKKRKQQEQNAFTQWVTEDKARKKYADALPLMQSAVEVMTPINRRRQIVSEVFAGAEAYRFASMTKGFIETKDTTKLKAIAKGFFKNYNAATDKKSTLRMFEIMADSLNADQTPKFLNFSFGKNYVANFENSVFTDYDRFMSATDDLDKFKQDPIFIDVHSNGTPIFKEEAKALSKAQADFQRGYRLYLAGLLEMNPEKAMYPDANFTIRMSYGNVKSYNPADATTYGYKTTLDGVVEKADPTNPDFDLLPELREKWETKDYGRWAEDGTIPTCFISTNDITGGNSGSPVINDNGELIGLAFDGNWEAMSGDIAFEPDLQRCINVDVRYLLFVVDKIGNAPNIIEELTLR